jgi:hypothetical protein
LIAAISLSLRAACGSAPRPERAGAIGTELAALHPVIEPVFVTDPGTEIFDATLDGQQAVTGEIDDALAKTSLGRLAKTSLGTASTNPNIPVSQIDNSKAQRFEGVASQSVTFGTVGTTGWDKIRSWVKAICLACISVLLRGRRPSHAAAA